MWKAPYRPKDEITQGFNDGTVTIYAQIDVSNPGYQPKLQLKKKIALRYEERKLGIQRYYAAAQNQIRVERVIRVPQTGKVTSQDVAITEDGAKYRIDLVQKADVYPPSVDLTLVRYDQTAEVTE